MHSDANTSILYSDSGKRVSNDMIWWDWPNPKQSAVFCSKSNKNKVFKLAWGLVFRACQTPVPWSLCVPAAGPDSALIRTVLAPCAYSSTGGFLVLLFLFLHYSQGAHTSLPSQDVHISENIFFWDQFVFIPCLRWPESEFPSNFGEGKSIQPIKVFNLKTIYLWEEAIFQVPIRVFSPSQREFQVFLHLFLLFFIPFDLLFLEFSLHF